MLNQIVLNRIFYIYKKDLALNNLEWLICYKTKPSLTLSLSHQTYTNEDIKFAYKFKWAS